VVLGEIDFNMILERKAFCSLKVPSYRLLLFMKAFSNIIDEDMMEDIFK